MSSLGSLKEHSAPLTERRRGGAAVHRAPARRRANRRSTGRGLALAFLAYLGYALFISWPLPTDPAGLIGGSSLYGDLTGGTAQIGYAIGHGVWPFLPGTAHGLNAPEGLHTAWVLNWANAPDVALKYLLALPFGAVAGANLFLWLSFVLSGVSMFLLTRRLFGSELAAGLAGFAFAFYPFAVNKIAGHVEYMNGWLFVLQVWRMLELARTPTRRNALLAGSATALSMWFTPYFVLFGGVVYVTMSAIVWGAGAARGAAGRAFRTVLLSAVPIAILFGALGILSRLAGGTQTGALRSLPIADLYTFSARWFEWLLPDANNLLFGRFTGSYLVSHLDGSNFSESALYLGVSVLVLAGTGFALTVRRIRVLERMAADDPSVLAGVAGAALAVVSLLFSLPPTLQILGRPLTMPSGFVYQLTATWRDYSRFVEVTELGLCILLALAVSWILGRCRGRSRWLVFALLATVLCLDLWARPPAPRTTKVTLPPAYRWLHNHPGGIVADYPLLPAAYPNYSPLFYSWLDGHPSFQGYAEGTESEAMKLTLGDLREARTAPELAALGVRYVVVHPRQPGGGASAMRRRHYVLRFASPGAEVWQVAARPLAVRVDIFDGFAPPGGRPGHKYQPMTGPGVLGITSRDCAGCRATLTFSASSNRYPRVLTVSEAATGRTLARLHVPAQTSKVFRIPGIRLAAGTERLDLATDLPPSLTRHPRKTDPTSIYLEEPKLTLSPR